MNYWHNVVVHLSTTLLRQKVYQEIFLQTANNYITWQVPNVIPKDSCTKPLVFKPCILRLYAPLRALSKWKRAVVGITL